MALRAILAVGACSACNWIGVAYAQSSPDELSRLSIEELANLEVTTVSRRPEMLRDASAAVDVITAADIRESGAQSLPEALRLARNLEVARVSAQHYSITARGFGTFQASNKLLVLMDGRSVYTPLYSGVFWDQQFVQLQNIDRIEVVSGPGGTLWGANAVNGVINVITKSSADTQGGQAEVAWGDVDSRIDLRYGGRLGEDASYRVFASGLSRGEMLTTTGVGADDGWDAGDLGFRSDWGGASDAFMVQGGYHERTDDADAENAGGHILGRWTHDFGDRSVFEAQAYYSDQSAREGGVSDALRTWDIALQHSIETGPHTIVWGGGYRISDSKFLNTNSPATLSPAARELRTSNIFVQDQIALSQDLELTLGIKIEDHTFTDIEYLPNARLSWRPTDRSVVWGAVSRAVRTPSRIDRELTAPGTIVPGNFDSEDLLAYEMGYRTQPVANLSLSANLFYHQYEGVRTLNFTPPGVLPVSYGNGLHGDIYGIEIWGDADVSDTWSLSAGLTLLEQDFEADPLTFDFNGTGDDPGYQIFLRSHADLAPDWSLDLGLRAIDEIAPQIPAYLEMDARLAWRLDKLELALVGRNLFDESHPESFDEGEQIEARRSVQLVVRVSY